MNRLRNRLVLIFLAATLAPLAATVWITTSLLEESIDMSSTARLDTLSKSLTRTAKEFYQRACEDLRRDAHGGKLAPRKYTTLDRAAWPDEVRAFSGGLEGDRFVRAGQDGNQLDYLVRHDNEIWVYSASLGDVALDRLTREIRDARNAVAAANERDLRRGIKTTYVLLAAGIWLISLALLVYLAHRISRPIQELTKGLGQLAGGDLKARVPARSDDEIGRAIVAFNNMAGALQQSTERLVYLRQLASWQTLARKMAHEVKNSLTPIRLTVEEMLVRYDDADRVFMEQATQIVVDEIETLERRIRAFSQFATEPPVQPGPVDVNSLLQERIAFLKTAHPEVAYDCRLTESALEAEADQDLLKGILTNLLENAAEAAGEGGKILGVTASNEGRVAIEVHDSGPGLSEQARASLFEPTISFKKRGMGLGLSIARKSALLNGGDIVVVKGELGGAGFRVLLPVATNGIETHSDRG
ncbi:MAG: integral rane sensor signal transduction histidine kinase [Candidatus Solibacter sp.]|nr:integral rane sensor signal transduction histidine kinase [Candidatus Solibacter sp.]